MRSRELKSTEWRDYFNGFSRRLLGQPVTVAVREKQAGLRVLARHVPLLGITSEPAQQDHEPMIEVMAGDERHGQITHLVAQPYRIRVGQVSNGSDEVLIIKAKDGDTTIVDFSPHGVIHETSSARPSLPLADVR